jgi:hypothetical protein
MEAARRLFRTSNRFGVFAFGIGPRVVAGRAGREMTLNVYVAHKHRRPRAPVPSIRVTSGSRHFVVEPNVIATGMRPRASSNGGAPFDGLYAGAPIRTGNQRGGVACFVGSGGEATHFLTAGHLFLPGAVGARVTAARSANATPAVVGRLAVNLLDSDGVDAAAVELTDAGRSMMETSSGGPPLEDMVGEASVWQQSVCAFRPMTHDFSRTAQTGQGPVDALLEASQRGVFWVRDVVGTDGTITVLGDSGSILCAGAANEFALGICSGEYHAQSVFEPVARVLRLLAPTLGALELTSNGG